MTFLAQDYDMGKKFFRVRKNIPENVIKTGRRIHEKTEGKILLTRKETNVKENKF